MKLIFILPFNSLAIEAALQWKFNIGNIGIVMKLSRFRDLCICLSCWIFQGKLLFSASVFQFSNCYCIKLVKTFIGTLYGCGCETLVKKWLQYQTETTTTTKKKQPQTPVSKYCLLKHCSTRVLGVFFFSSFVLYYNICCVTTTSFAQ